MEKTCAKCCKVKPVADFNKNGKYYSYRCKDCQRQYQKEYYLGRHEEIRARQKTTYNTNVQWFKNYKSVLSCIVCGENHPSCLEFHHRDSNSKDYNVGSMSAMVDIDKIKAEIAKCDILCSNCHRKLHYSGL